MSKHMELDWAFTPKYGNANTKCYSKQHIGSKVQKRNKILNLD